MNKANNTKIVFLNIIAFITVTIWATTFISSKILLKSLSPFESMFYRFLVAYFILLIIYPKFHKISSLKEELIFLICGITGGSLYFLGENTAVKISLASNVSLILSTAPVLTALLAHYFTKNEKLTKDLVIGFIIAITGVFLVIFNGNFILKLNPLGDLLALGSSLCWAIYSICIKYFGNKYNTIYLTRKIFFYALLTMIPLLFTSQFNFNLSTLMQRDVIINLLFLSVVASSICYVAWNYTVDKLGVIKTNNYLYFLPIITLILSYFVLGEKLTPYSFVGAVFILLGVYVSEKGFSFQIIQKHTNDKLPI
ncbi:DMT family transporter [Clostridium butyricum]|uniref:DMT family transporter n=1 Tax=Clostridium butyricum TaxID=1492 RepID=UPI001CA8D50C|nr:DMT family transporter [Clostridium butyricum]MBZ0312248.1 DMT family transporter [Clostridium butyricum]